MDVGAGGVFGFRSRSRNLKMYKKHTLIDSRWKWRRCQIWKEKWKLRAEFGLICVDETQPRRLAKKKHTDIKLIMTCLDKYSIPYFVLKKQNKKNPKTHKWHRAIDAFREEFPLINLISFSLELISDWEKKFLLKLSAWVKLWATKGLFIFISSSTPQGNERCIKDIPESLNSALSSFGETYRNVSNGRNSLEVLYLTYLCWCHSWKLPRPSNSRWTAQFYIQYII